MIQDSPLTDSLIASLLYQPELIFNVALPDRALFGMPGVVFAAMRDLAEHGAPISSLAVEDVVVRRGGVDVNGLRNYLRKIATAPITETVDNCVKSVLDIYERREAEVMAERLTRSALDLRSDIQETKAAVAGSLLRGFSDQHTVTAAEMLDADLEQVLAWANNPMTTNDVRGTRSGLHDLDMLIDGLWPGLFILAGRTSMGKTGLAIRLARGVAEHRPVLYCTFENSAEIIRRRMVCALAQIDPKEVKRGLKDGDFTRYQHASEVIAGLPLVFYSGERGLPYVTAAINREYHLRGDLGLVVLDNLGHVKTGEDMYLERGTVCKAMNALSARIGVTVLALSQINREPEKRGEKRPAMSDLSESGQIEQDADVIGLLYRDGYYNPASENPNALELAIAKNRWDGATGLVKLYYHKKSGEISNAGY